MALRVSERERRMVLSLLALIVIYLLYFQVYAPSSARLSSLRAEIELKRLQAQTMKQTALSVTTLERDLAELQRRLDTIWQGIGREPDLPWLVRSLGDYSEAAGARLVSLRPLDVVIQRYVAEMPFELTLQGTFDSILAFLRQAEEGHPAIVFTGIAAEALGTDDVATQPRLSVTISGKTYFRAGQDGGADL